MGVVKGIAMPFCEEKVVFEGKIHEVVQQQMKIGEVERTFEWIRRSPGTRLIVKDSAGRLLLTREYRRELGGYDYRLPGGKVFDTLAQYRQFLASGGNIADAAMAAATTEGAEEAGIKINSLFHFHTSTAGATITWDLHYFVVTDFETLDSQQLGEGEDITVEWLTPDQLYTLLLDGKMSEDRSVGVLYRYMKLMESDSI